MAENNVRCKVLLFAQAAEIVGKHELELEILEGTTVRELFARLCVDSPNLTSIESACAFAIDKAIVDKDKGIAEGCTVAVLPPVSGG